MNSSTQPFSNYTMLLGLDTIIEALHNAKRLLEQRQQIHLIIQPTSQLAALVSIATTSIMAATVALKLSADAPHEGGIYAPS